MLFFGAILWLILCFVVASIGNAKSIGSTGAFLVSLFFSPLIGLLVVIASTPKKNKKSNNPKAEKLNDIAVKEFKKEEYQKAIDLLNEALTIQHDSTRTHFNLSCLYSVTKDKEKAYEHLSKAVEFGYKRFEYISKAKELEWLRGQKDYKDFASNGYKFKSEASKENDYIREIEKLANLKEKGLLTNEEFEEQKRKILSSNS